jgi:hypothetical protein
MREISELTSRGVMHERRQAVLDGVAREGWPVKVNASGSRPPINRALIWLD